MSKRIKYQSTRKFFLTYLMVTVIMGLTGSIGAYYFTQKPTLRPLAMLKIPKEPTIYLPGPLIDTENLSSPVLGAQTIDPKDIVLYINAERMKRNAPPLKISPTLTQAAQLRADVILKYQNFSHQDPYEHTQLDTVLPKLGYQFSYASENIGMGDNSAKAFVFGFMHSAAHRENLLNPLLQETGVAIVTGPYNQYYVNIAVQLFGVPVSRTDSLGYSKDDIEKYKQLLRDTEKQIALARQLMTKEVDNKEYYEGWEKILIRQEEILATVYSAMLQQQPLVKDFVTMIREYNNNWNLVPKQTRS